MTKSELIKEVADLADLLTAKDKLIAQMSEINHSHEERIEDLERERDELRELISWYLECNDLFVGYQLNTRADGELLKTSRAAGYALREAVKEG